MPIRSQLVRTASGSMIERTPAATSVAARSV